MNDNERLSNLADAKLMASAEADIHAVFDRLKDVDNPENVAFFSSSPVMAKILVEARDRYASEEPESNAP